MKQRTFVSYLRVSTDRQGRSGLGLEAQRDAVTNFLIGGEWRLISEVVEIESGKRNDRPKLQEALRLCRVHNATLVIAKLDRLARNVAFVSNLMESGVDFVAVDFPQANRLTIHILAAVAEYEAKAISERTKAALAAAKKRGVSLGGFRGKVTINDEARGLAQLAIANRIKKRASDLVPVLEDMSAKGFTTLTAIANELTARGIPTPLGRSEWKPTQVARLLKAQTEPSSRFSDKQHATARGAYELSLPHDETITITEETQKSVERSRARKKRSGKNAA